LLFCAGSLENEMIKKVNFIVKMFFCLSFSNIVIAQPNEKIDKFEENLQSLANLFFPSDGLEIFVKDACRVAYKTKLSKTPEDIELEQTIPGIHDTMVAASGDYCDKEIPKLFKAQKDLIKQDWRSDISTNELQRIVELFETDIQKANGIRIGMQEGDMALDAVKRMPDLTAAENRLFQQKQQAFAKTPNGIKILNRISAYQTKMSTVLNDGSWLAPMMTNAIAESNLAANTYAKKRGFSNPYPERK
jgi:hypothetical protein